LARFEIYSTRTILQRLVGWLFEQRKLHVAKLDLAWDGKQWIQKKLQFHSIGSLFIYSSAKFRSGNPRIAPLEFHLKSQYQSSAQTDMVVALQLIIPPTTLNHFDWCMHSTILNDWKKKKLYFFVYPSVWKYQPLYFCWRLYATGQNVEPTLYHLQFV